MYLPNPLQSETHLHHFITVLTYDAFIPTCCDNVIKLMWSHRIYLLQWVNGVKVTQHAGGHLPFEVEIGSLIRKDPTTPCRITIAVNNTLNLDTLPPGKIQYMEDRTK